MNNFRKRSLASSSPSLTPKSTPLAPNNSGIAPSQTASNSSILSSTSPTTTTTPRLHSENNAAASSSTNNSSSNKANLSTTNSSSWISLNVGGIHFETSAQTITKAKESLLYFMVKGSTGVSSFKHHQMANQFFTKDENGVYRIDRSPEYFKVILNFLRSGELVVEPNVSLEGVLIEAKFYNIDDLIRAATNLQKLQHQHPAIVGAMTTTTTAAPAQHSNSVPVSPTATTTYSPNDEHPIPIQHDSSTTDDVTDVLSLQDNDDQQQQQQQYPSWHHQYTNSLHRQVTAKLKAATNGVVPEVNLAMPSPRPIYFPEFPSSLASPRVASTGGNSSSGGNSTSSTSSSLKSDISREQLLNIVLSTAHNSSMRLRGLCLVGLDVSRLDFSHANMQLCNLTKSNFGNCDLSQVNLKTSVCSNTIFQGSLFHQSQLSKGYFKYSDFTVCQVVQSNLENCDFSNCNMERIVIRDSILNGCNFSDANLKNCLWINVEANNTNFLRASLEMSKFKNCKFEGACFAHAVLSIGTTFCLSILQKTDILQNTVLTAPSSGGTTGAGSTGGGIGASSSSTLPLPGSLTSGSVSPSANSTCIEFLECDFQHALYDIKKYFKKVKLYKCNFGKCDWIGEDLSGIDLRECIFFQASLKQVNFSKAVLELCKFVQCDLKGADLQEVGSMQFCDFTKSDLRGAKYNLEVFAKQSVILHQVNFSGEDWSNQSLSSTSSQHQQQFTDDILRYYNPANCNASNLNMVGANLSTMNLSFTNLSHSNLKHANLSNSDLYKVDLSYCDLSGAKYDIQELKKASSIKKANFTKANWQNYDLRGMNLEEVVLKDANLKYSDLEGVNLRDTDLQCADLRYSRYKIEDIWQANYLNARLHGENIVTSSFGGYSGDLLLFDIGKNSHRNIIGNQRHSKIQCFQFLNHLGLTGDVDGNLVCYNLNRALNNESTEVDAVNVSGAALDDDDYDEVTSTISLKSASQANLLNNSTIHSASSANLHGGDAVDNQYLVGIIRGHGSIDCLRFDKETLLLGRRNNIEIWSLKNVINYMNQYGYNNNSSTNFNNVSAAAMEKIVVPQPVHVLQNAHDKLINCLVHDSNSHLAISGSYDTSIKVWDLNAQKLVRHFKGHAGSVKCLHYNHQNQTLMSAGHGDSMFLWDLRTNPSNNSNTAVSLLINNYSAVPVTTGYTTKIQLPSNITAVSNLERVGNNVIWTGANDNCIRVWDIRNFANSTNSTSSSSSTAASADSGSSAAASSAAAAAAVTSHAAPSSGSTIPTTSLQQSLNSLVNRTVSSPSSSPVPTVSTTISTTINSSNSSSSKLTSYQSFFVNPISTVTRSSRAASTAAAQDKKGNPERVLLGHTQPINCINILGNTLVSGSEDCSCLVWNLQTGKPTHQLQANSGPVRLCQILN